MQSLNRVAQSALAGPLKAAPLSQGKVTFVWSAVVGPAVARATSVRLEGSCLLIDASTPGWQREVRRATPAILPRLQTLLGAGTITRLEVRRA